jgi:hypothetical protein
MTMRLIDVAPNEAPLTLLVKRLEHACSGGEPVSEAEIRMFLELDPGLPEPVKAVLREYLSRSISTSDSCKPR